MVVSRGLPLWWGISKVGSETMTAASLPAPEFARSPSGAVRPPGENEKDGGQGRGSSVPPGSWANLSHPICLLTSPPEAGESQYQEAAHAELLSQVQLSATPWTVACQTSLSMGFPKQDYWSGLSFPPPGDLPDPCIELMSPALQDKVGDRARTCHSPEGDQRAAQMLPRWESD